MDADNPQRHGPYHKLAYVHRGHPVCRFVRSECVADLTNRLAAYKSFRALVDRWIELSIQQGTSDFFTHPSSNCARGKTATAARKHASR